MLPDTHDYSETETRDSAIDLLHKEAGWTLEQPRDRELKVSGMPNREGKGFVDYVPWDGDGRPFGLVEAMRTRRDARIGQHPLIFYSNGYEHWLWDDTRYQPVGPAQSLSD